MLLIDIRSTNASAAEFILYRLKLYLAGRHHHMIHLKQARSFWRVMKCDEDTQAKPDSLVEDARRHGDHGG